MISPFYEDEEYPYNLTSFNEEDKEEEFNDMIEQLVKPKCVGILEDDENRFLRMKNLMFKCQSDVISIQFNNAYELIDWLSHRMSAFLFISLNYELKEFEEPVGNGISVVKHLLGMKPAIPVLIHTEDKNAGMMMETWLNAHGWDVKRIDFRKKHAYNEWADKASEIIKQYKSKMVSM